MISGEKESSYQVEALLPTTDLSSVGQPLADKLSQEWDEFDSMTKEQQCTSSKLWGVVDIQTDTWDDCEEAIGFTLYNPLETLDWLNKTGYFGMEHVDSQTPTAHVQATANASQTADRKLGEVSVIAGYKDGDVRITLTETVSSSTESFTIGSVYTGYATYEQDTVTTGSGIVVLIMTVNGTNNIGYLPMVGKEAGTNLKTDPHDSNNNSSRYSTSRKQISLLPARAYLCHAARQYFLLRLYRSCCAVSWRRRLSSAVPAGRLSLAVE